MIDPTNGYDISPGLLDTNSYIQYLLFFTHIMWFKAILLELLVTTIMSQTIWQYDNKQDFKAAKFKQNNRQVYNGWDQNKKKLFISYKKHGSYKKDKVWSHKLFEDVGFKCEANKCMTTQCN